jgi:hypothetical protein
MTKTLVIHIGGHKTGSTTIQESFAAGQVRLEGAQVLYPARLDHNYLRADVLSHVNGTPLPTRGPRLLGFAQLAKRITNGNARYTLLSAEYLETVEADVLKQIVAQYFEPVVDEVRIVAYVRPHISRLLSGYSEALKIGWFQDGLDVFFDKTVADGTQHYAARFSEWRAAFGDAFVLRPMIRSQLAGGSVLEDFITTAFPGERTVALPDKVSNPSLDLQDLTFVQMMLEPFQTRKSWFRHTFGWELARQLQAISRDPDAVIPQRPLDRALARRIAEAYHADAAKMDTGFFGGVPLFQDALHEAVAVAPDTALTCTPEDVLRPDMMRNIQALRAVLGDVFEARYNWSAHFHGKRIDAVERTLAASRTDGSGT